MNYNWNNVLFCIVSIFLLITISMLIQMTRRVSIMQWYVRGCIAIRNPLKFIQIHFSFGSSNFICAAYSSPHSETTDTCFESIAFAALQFRLSLKLYFWLFFHQSNWFMYLCAIITSGSHGARIYNSNSLLDEQCEHMLLFVVCM